MKIREALTFDDVLLEPAASAVLPNADGYPHQTDTDASSSAFRCSPPPWTR